MRRGDQEGQDLGKQSKCEISQQPKSSPRAVQLAPTSNTRVKGGNTCRAVNELLQFAAVSCRAERRVSIRVQNVCGL